jgi:hypothetical protein
MSVALDDLQNPGYGPTFVPPKQIASFVGHVIHSPGDVIATKANAFPDGH